jgi:hypothetical protein
MTYVITTTTKEYKQCENEKTKAGAGEATTSPGAGTAAGAAVMAAARAAVARSPAQGSVGPVAG